MSQNIVWLWRIGNRKYGLRYSFHSPAPTTGGAMVLTSLQCSHVIICESFITCITISEAAKCMTIGDLRVRLTTGDILVWRCGEMASKVINVTNYFGIDFVIHISRSIFIPPICTYYFPNTCLHYLIGQVVSSAPTGKLTLTSIVEIGKKLSARKSVTFFGYKLSSSLFFNVTFPITRQKCALTLQTRRYRALADVILCLQNPKTL